MVTFKTNSHRNIDMFTGDAHAMLKLMGLSTTVPSALRAEDVPAALERLQQAIENIQTPPQTMEPDEAEEEGDEADKPIALKTRAEPLIGLLATAARANEHVIWE
ncbi:hypothetical protein J2T55_001577 [Methylohalomonas lacus]|uniref:DUF1840 domain-containing protein n=1 Tax=Methylohalomonas lacus TaxID=398773 RepID=A0AAE3L1U1_9GAMM|nr:DUF1840 domain-containing protein [Methylohalomonas lacus]MCS3903551.1 hypothetical protein [Methylohalomonas lacus]